MTALLVGVTSYLTAGILSLVFHRFRGTFSLLAWFGGLAGFSFSVFTYLDTGTTITRLGNWGKLGIELRLDETTVLFVALGVVLNIVTLLYIESFEEKKKATFYGLFNFLFATAFSMAFSNDLFNIYVTIELMSLLSILLIGYEREAYQIYAGIKYLLLSSLAMSLYLIGLGIVYMNGGFLGIEALVGVLGENAGFSTSLGISLMVTGLAVKGGVLLFSMWLPDAYSYSGTVVSVLLAGIATKFGLVGIIRLAQVGEIGLPLLVIGGLAGIGGALLALIGNLPKRILAYSTISQVGLILIGIGSGSRLGIIAASLHIFFHGLLKALLFLSVGHAGVGKKSLYDDEGFDVPIASKLAMVVGSLSVMAVVPFGGYFTKGLLNYSVPGKTVWYLVVTISVLTVAYYLRLNYALLRGRTGKKFNADDLLLVLFAAVVAGSGLVTVMVPGVEFLEMLNLRDVVTSFGVVLGGGLLLIGIWRPLKVFKPPSLIFNLDNSLISLFAGSLLLSLFIFL